MEPVNALIVSAALAWIGQIALGWLQINRFNRALTALSDYGVVKIGRSTGRFKPRVVLALAISEQGVITNNFVMKGFTVFSRPYAEATLNGIRLDEIRSEVIFPANKMLQEALTLAISNRR